MHIEAYTFMRRELNGLINERMSVLEIGSRNINGSVRTLAGGAGRYVGIDPVEGPGVDIVSDAASYQPESPFDIVISNETMEHMARPEELIACALRSLKPGGFLFLTAAAPERAAHAANGGPPADDEAYTPIEPQQLHEWLAEWNNVQVWHDAAHGDVYARARAPQATATVEVLPVKRSRKSAASESEAQP